VVVASSQKQNGVIMWLYAYFIIMMLETQIFNIQQSVTSGKAEDFNHVSTWSLHLLPKLCKLITPPNTKTTHQYPALQLNVFPYN